jgi:ubiquinone/menaquinone biosynthesis C-methylase UbiE
MHNLINAFPLYNFLKYCNSSSHEKIILDCGAGGSNPPLSLFYEFKYKTYGIEISEEQLMKANEFCKIHNVDLNIISGDMTRIPFGRDFFSFLFSYNTSVHMKKSVFLVALQEFFRVLKPDGLCYVNFLSEQCSTYGKGIEIRPGEFIQNECGQEVLYSHYKDNEIEKTFNGFNIVYRETRVIKRNIDGEEHTSGYFDYILEKK